MTVYAFGPFRFDTLRGTLHRGAQAIPLPGRLAQLLLMLIQAGGSVVDKTAIAAAIWPEGGLSEGNLSQHVYMIRQILSERARDRSYILTVRGKGYRFVAPVGVIAPGHGEAPPEETGDERLDGALMRDGFGAFNHYCRGCYLVEKRTATALGEAAEQFARALELEPTYVPAWVGFAKAYSLLAEYWYAPGSYTFAKAKAAAMKALEIDPSSGDAHALLGNILLFCDWSWEQGEREIETALRLNPHSTLVHINAAWFYLCKGGGRRPLREMQRALMMEPSSPSLQLFLARTFLHSGEYERSIEALSSLIESGPEFSIARRHRAQAFILNRQPAEALNDLLLMPQDRAEDLALRLPLLARAYADSGDLRRAEEIYASLLERARNEYVVGFNLALVAVGLGKADQALEHLERAFKRREPSLLMLRSLPFFGPIEQRARYKAIVDAIWPQSPVREIPASELPRNRPPVAVLRGRVRANRTQTVLPAP